MPKIGAAELDTTDEARSRVAQTKGGVAQQGNEGGGAAEAGAGGGGGGVQLKRELGLFSAVNLIVGVMIGSGIFVSPTSALQRSGSVGMCLVIWVVCGFISLLGALAFAELGTVVPRSGAEYAYFQEAFAGGGIAGGGGKIQTGKTAKWGPLPAFLCSWIYVLALRPAEIAVIILTFSEYSIRPFLPDGPKVEVEESFFCEQTATKLMAIVAVGLMTYINIVSVKLYVKVQNVFTVCKLLVCFAVIVGGLYELCIGNVQHLSKGFEGTTTSPGDYALAFYSGLWAYDGWSTVTVVTEEIKRPEVNIPRSIAIGVPLVTLVYCLMNLSYMTVLSIPEMINAPAVAVVFGDKILGVMTFIIPLGVALSTFGCALGIQFSVTRLCFVAGREGHMLQALSYVHMKRFTPAPAVILQGLLTALFIVGGNIVELIDFASFLVWIFYGGAMVALLVLRRTKPEVHRPYKVPIVIPIFILIVALYLAIIPIVTDPSAKYLFAVFLIAIGVAVYVLFVQKKRKLPCIDSLTRNIQLLMEVVPSEKQLD
ncbi:b(0,+)-type amino acid transporter 1-like [Ischnura elegans]|uniref:b(0,+)-type amino acid transporter 1-like n=1 Tax=Ischnura elegans TaxID=197161 RepID=UPI001ED8A43A|nr:b(0,+)-type amino acid transporter 1-like [Ischnura elegans]